MGSEPFSAGYVSAASEISWSGVSAIGICRSHSVDCWVCQAWFAAVQALKRRRPAKFVQKG